MGSTLDRMTTDPNGYVKERLDDLIEREQKAVDKFITDFSKDPRYTLRWADATFLSVAVLDTAKQYREYLTQCMEPDKWLCGNTRDAMVKWLKESCRQLEQEMFRHVRDTGQSTSVCANLMERSASAAQWKVYELFKQLIGWIEYEEFEERVRKDFQWLASQTCTGMGYALKVKDHIYVVRKRKPKGKEWIIVEIKDGVEPPEYKGARFESSDLAMVKAERDAVSFLREQERGMHA